MISKYSKVYVNVIENYLEALKKLECLQKFIHNYPADDSVVKIRYYL